MSQLRLIDSNGQPIGSSTDSEKTFTLVEQRYEQAYDLLRTTVQALGQEDSTLTVEQRTEHFLQALQLFHEATNHLVVNRNDQLIKMANALREAAAIVEKQSLRIRHLETSLGR